MKAIRIHAQINQDHELVLRNLPLDKGKNVEVIIIEEEANRELEHDERFPLRGKPIRFDNPFVPVIDATDWNAAQ